MRKSTIAVETRAKATYGDFEVPIRKKIRGFFQDVIEEELRNTWGARSQSEDVRRRKGGRGTGTDMERHGSSGC
jgi:hypothetical protein